MKRSGMLLMILGLVVALLSGLAVFSTLKNQTAPVTPTPIPTIKVVVAAQNIPERTVLQANMLTVKDWPQDLAPLGTVSKTQELVGKVTAGSLAVGEPVLTSKVSLEQQTVGLAPTLPPGLVAVALSLPASSAVGGAVRAGDSVDIMISLDYSDYNEQGDESKPLHVTFYTIQDVPVLSAPAPIETAATQAIAGNSTGRSQPTATSNMLTVLVTPQDALLLKYAREQGAIDLALRSPQFHDQVTTDPVFLEYITRRFDLPRPLIIRKQQASAGEPQ